MKLQWKLLLFSLALLLSWLLPFTINITKANDTGWVQPKEAVNNFDYGGTQTWNNVTKVLGLDDDGSDVNLPARRSSYYIETWGYNFGLTECDSIEDVDVRFRVKRSGSSTSIKSLIPMFRLANGDTVSPETLLPTSWTTAYTWREFTDFNYIPTYDELIHGSFLFGAQNQSTTLGGFGWIDATEVKVTYTPHDCFKLPSWFQDMIPTAYATTTCTALSASTTQCINDATTTAAIILDDPTRNLFYGFLLFFIVLFGLLFFWNRKGGD